MPLRLAATAQAARACSQDLGFGLHSPICSQLDLCACAARPCCVGRRCVWRAESSMTALRCVGAVGAPVLAFWLGLRCRRRRRRRLPPAPMPVPPIGETITVHLDQARILKLPERTATLVVGNPLIADAAVQPGGIAGDHRQELRRHQPGRARPHRRDADGASDPGAGPARARSSWSIAASSANPIAARRTASGGSRLAIRQTTSPPTSARPAASTPRRRAAARSRNGRSRSARRSWLAARQRHPRRLYAIAATFRQRLVC